MKYAIMLGSNMFIGTSGILTVEENGNHKEFFKIREIDRSRSEGTYIVLDCDIKDQQGEREVKLFKSRPVVQSDEIDVDYSHDVTCVRRKDGSVVIKVELVNHQDDSIPRDGPVAGAIQQMDAILRVTGDFFAGPYHLQITAKDMRIGGITISENLMCGTGGMHLTQMGFAM